MKLSHLSLAIFAAISLAACGGSNNSNQVTPEKNVDTGNVPDVNPEEGTGVIPKEIIDPSQTGKVGELDTTTRLTQGSYQYIRDDKSDFDRANNLDKATSATAILGVDADSQNPNFTNIVRARFIDENNKLKIVQYIGQDRENAGNFAASKSLQRQNELNVNLRGLNKGHGVTGTGFGDYDTIQAAATVKAQLDNLNKAIANLEAASSLTFEQKQKLQEAKDYQVVLKDLSDKLNAPDSTYGVDLLSLRYDSDGIAKQNWFGDLVETSKTALDAVAGGNGVESTDKGPKAIGLVGVNYNGLQDPTIAFDATTNKVVSKHFQGLEKNSKSSTRIFGRRYNTSDISAAGYHNSFETATSFIPEKKLGEVTDPASTSVTDSIAALKNLQISANLAAVPLTLNFVQYGRVTGNLDPVEYTRTDGEIQYVQSPFLRKGDDKAVDTYFYRGADATTFDQMASLKKDLDGKTVTYKGHALMYGIDNSYHGGSSRTDVPTAIGTNAGSHALGNFVIANVNLTSAKLTDGKVYNVWIKNDGVKAYADTLVEFKGNIFGNTVIGDAHLAYNEAEKADFRGGFFGAKAEELGGSFNSTTWQERYGANGPVWGGVFGAHAVDVPVKSNLTNSDLGDANF